MTRISGILGDRVLILHRFECLLALESPKYSLWRGRVAHPSMMLPSFIYKISEHRIGKIALYVVIFAAVFAFIVMYLIHLEGGVL
jgi:hypothetical protein